MTLTSLTIRRILFIGFAVTALMLSGCASDIDDLDRWDEVRLYQEAKGAMARGEFQTAIRRLETLNARYPFDDYAIQGQLDLMYAYFKSMRMEDVISTAQRFARLNPTHPKVDYALYMQGLADFDLNKSFLQRWFPRDPSEYELPVLERSFNAFAELVRRFPDSEYAPDGERRMIYLRNQLAEACMSRATWYVRREAWLSAAQRAQQCIQRYNGAPAVEKALGIMANSYEKLDMPQLASATRNRSSQTAPTSK